MNSFETLTATEKKAKDAKDQIIVVVPPQDNSLVVEALKEISKKANPQGYIHLRVGFLTILGGLFALCLVLFQAEGRIFLRYVLFQQGIIANPQTQLFLEKGCIADGGVIIPSHEEGVLATPLPGGNKCSRPHG